MTAIRSHARIPLLRAAAIGVALLVAGTACSPTDPDPSEEPAMEYADARAELTDLFERIQDRIGGEWQRMDGGAFPCGDDGAQGLLTRIGPGVPADQQAAIVEFVVDELDRAGFPPSTAELPPVDGAVVTEVSYPARDAEDPDGVQITVGIGPNATDVSGQTRCVPGDPDQLNVG